MNHYVYLLTSKDLIKYYIGVRSCKGSPSSDNYWGSSRHLGEKATRPDRFYKTVLGIYETREDALSEEIRLHNYYDVAVNSKFYNKAKQTSTGFNTYGVSLPPPSKETVRKRQESRKGYRHSDETKARMSKSHFGKTVSEEAKQAMSLGMKGRKSRLGIPHTDETKAKLSKANKGSVRSDEVRKRMSVSHGVPVIQINLDSGEVVNTFSSCKEAGASVNGHGSPVSAVCNGRAKTYKGFLWQYKKDMEVKYA